MDVGNPCGIVSGFLDRRDATRAHLASMWVAASHRSGIGRLLINAIIEWAQLHSADTLQLTVRQS
ncbi:MAG TPA: GNAT family N-acetyltransferase [Candidatus Binatia bacterium]